MADFGALKATTGNQLDGGEAARIQERLKLAEQATRPGQTLTDNKDHKLFPVQFNRADPEELRKLVEYPRIAESLGYKSPQAPSSLWKYLEEREQDATYWNLQQWLTKRYDLSNPAIAEWLRKIFPEFYEQRKKYAYAKLNTQRQLFDILNEGAQSMDDFHLLFAIDEGRLNLEELQKPIWETNDAATTAKDFAEQIFKLPSTGLEFTNRSWAFTNPARGIKSSLPETGGTIPDGTSQWETSPWNAIANAKSSGWISKMLAAATRPPPPPPPPSGSGSGSG